jgi:colicin import membrane protein
MAEVLNLAEDCDMCPIYCPKHLQKHIDAVKNGETLDEVTKDKQPKSKKSHQNQNDFEEELDSKEDEDFSEGEGEEEERLSQLEFVEGESPNKKGRKKRSRVEGDGLSAIRQEREAEKQRKKLEREAEREKRKQEKQRKLEIEKQIRAEERKKRKEFKKQEKLQKEQDMKKVIIRRSVGRNLESNAVQKSNQWKTFMEMGKKREQELHEMKKKKKLMRQKKRVEKEDKKKEESKNKAKFILSTKHQEVKDAPKNEAFEMAKKQYLEQIRKQKAGVVITAKRTTKQMLSKAPKSIIKKKAQESQPTDDIHLKMDNRQSHPQVKVEDDGSVRYEQVNAGKFKFQKIQEKTDIKEEIEQKAEVRKKEVVNRPVFNYKNIPIQQSMRNYSCRARKHQVNIPRPTQQIVSNPYFKPVNKPSTNPITYSSNISSSVKSNQCPETSCSSTQTSSLPPIILHPEFIKQ